MKVPLYLEKTAIAQNFTLSQNFLIELELESIETNINQLDLPWRVLPILSQVLTQLCQVATIVYGPAMALELTTGIPIPWLLVIIPAVGIVYTSLGGKAI